MAVPPRGQHLNSLLRSVLCGIGWVGEDRGPWPTHRKIAVAKRSAIDVNSIRQYLSNTPGVSDCAPIKLDRNVWHGMWVVYIEGRHISRPSTQPAVIKAVHRP